MENKRLIKDINALDAVFSSIVIKRLSDLKRRRFNQLGSSIIIKANQSSFINGKTTENQMIDVTEDQVFDYVSSTIGSITTLLKKVDLSRLNYSNHATENETNLYNSLKQLIIINKNHLIEKTIRALEQEKEKNLIAFITFDSNRPINEKQALLSKNESFGELIRKYENMQSVTRLILDNNEIQRFYFKYIRFKENGEDTPSKKAKNNF